MEGVLGRWTVSAGMRHTRSHLTNAGEDRHKLQEAAMFNHAHVSDLCLIIASFMISRGDALKWKALKKVVSSFFHEPIFSGRHHLNIRKGNLFSFEIKYPSVIEKWADWSAFSITSGYYKIQVLL